MKKRGPSPEIKTQADLPTLRQLANFRYQLRKFLRFSERAARSNGVTSQQHQLLLGIAGFTRRGWATITELAEFLQERHNAVVGLVQRAELRGLVRKDHGSSDQRFVRVYLLPKGETILARLSQSHRREVKRFEAGLLSSVDFLPDGTGKPGGEPRRQGVNSGEKARTRKLRASK